MSHISLESGICLQSLLVTNDYMICLSWYPFLMTLLSKNPEYIRHKFPAITQNMLTPPHWGKSVCLSKAYPFCFCTPVTLHLLPLSYPLSPLIYFYPRNTHQCWITVSLTPFQCLLLSHLPKPKPKQNLHSHPLALRSTLSFLFYPNK